MYTSILRIIEGAQQNDVDKVIAYAKQILPKDELEIGEKCIREMFNPNAVTIFADEK